MRRSWAGRVGSHTVGVDLAGRGGDYSVVAVLKPTDDGKVECLGVEQMKRGATEEDAQAAARRILARANT